MNEQTPQPSNFTPEDSKNAESIKDNIEKIAESSGKVNENLGEVKNSLEKSNDILKDTNKNFDELLKKAAEIEKKLSEIVSKFKEANDSANNQVELSEEEYAELEKQLKELKSIDAEFEKIAKTKKELNTISENFSKKIEKIDEDVKDWQNMFDKTTDSIEKWEKSVDGFSSEIEKSVASIASAKLEFESLESIGRKSINKITAGIIHLVKDGNMFQKLITKMKVSYMEYVNDVDNKRTKLIANVKEGFKSVMFNPFVPLGLGLAALIPMFLLMGKSIGAAIERYKELDEAAESFRKTTGFTKDMISKELNSAIVGSLVNAKESAEAAASIANEYGNITLLSKDLVKTTALFSQNLGVSADNSAGVLKNFNILYGLSEGQAIELSKSTAYLAKLSGLAPNKVFEELKEISADTVAFMGKQPEKLALAVVKTKQLGLQLNQVANIAKSLLDIESSIANEMEASVLLGKQINFDKARELALNGDLLGVSEEILKQVGGISEFNKLNVLQKEALAKATGMDVKQLQETLALQEKLSKANNLNLEQRKKAEEALKSGNYELAKQILNQDQIAGRETALERQRKAAMNKFAEAGMAVLKAFQPVTDVVLKIVGVLAKELPSIMKDSGLTGVLQNLGKSFATFFKENKETIVSTIKNILSFLSGGMPKFLEIVGNVGSKIAKIIEKAWEIGKVVIPPLASFVGLLAEKVADLFSAIFNLLTLDFQNFGKSVESFLSGGIKGVLAGLGAIVATVGFIKRGGKDDKTILLEYEKKIILERKKVLEREIKLVEKKESETVKSRSKVEKEISKITEKSSVPSKTTVIRKTGGSTETRFLPKVFGKSRPDTLTGGLGKTAGVGALSGIGGIGESIGGVIATGLEVFTKFLGMLSSPQVLIGFAAVTLAIKVLEPIFIKLVETLPDIVRAFGDLAANVLPVLFSALQPILPAFESLIFGIMDRIPPIIDAILSPIQPFIKAFESFYKIIEPLIPKIQEFLSALIDKLMPYLPKVVDAFSPLISILKTILETFDSVLKGVVSFGSGVWDVASSIGSGIVSITKVFQSESEKQAEIARRLVEEEKKRNEERERLIKGVSDKLIEGIGNVDMNQFLKGFTPDKIKNFVFTEDMKKNLLDFFQFFATNTETLSKSLPILAGLSLFFQSAGQFSFGKDKVEGLDRLFTMFDTSNEKKKGFNVILNYDKAKMDEISNFFSRLAKIFDEFGQKIMNVVEPLNIFNDTLTKTINLKQLEKVTKGEDVSKTSSGKTSIFESSKQKSFIELTGKQREKVIEEKMKEFSTMNSLKNLSENERILFFLAQMTIYLEEIAKNGMRLDGVKVSQTLANANRL